MQHRGTQRLETERLVLRRFVPEDALPMYRNWAGDPEVTRFLTWPAHASPEVSRNVIDMWLGEYSLSNTYHWALELKQAGEPIGSLGVVRMDEQIAEAELGYCIGRAWWGQGLMPEAVRAVIEYLFNEVGFNRICARHDVENPKSGRVMRKAGMTFEGVSRQAGYNNRGIVDQATCAILRSDRDIG